ncbi:pyrroline-5-carboxylate reductase [Leekyejoonella antrihumi]|uniref:Pyrroline-5-carboxylate reductase n=1 Tax=Leekyejoonella antrihumi TaxID=1660198 RepID=A0A563DYF3_9MICO|nr:pyrroline-5-carboxylate reductase [Leekyejoonella antrihumi]TWP34714.1 pyrroline-5-carboxylate reductase [Leekyejoonella antrihumi]
MEETNPPATGLVALLGAGVMGEALMSGLLRSGWRPADLRVSDRSPERLADLQARYGVTGLSPAEAVAEADTVVIAVKPQDMTALLDEVGPHLRPHVLVVSIAAGITTAFLEQRLPEGTAVARVMPNTPALVDEGMSAVSPGAHCRPAQVEIASELMRGCGKVLAVPEKQQDAITAISGSGPAYIFYVVEAMIEAGVLLGLPRATATELTVQTLYGAATMLKETGEHPTVLRERVSSPGGTTVTALRELEDHKVRAAFLRAIEAAAVRSAELSSGQ